MTNLTESQIEPFALEQFQLLGYDYVYAPNTASDGKTPVRASFEKVVLHDRLNNAVLRINKDIPHDA